MEASFNLATYALLLLVLIFSLISFWRPNRWTGRLAEAGSVLAWLGMTLALALRALGAGRLPVASLYEFSLLMVWGMMAFTLIIYRRTGSQLVLVLATLLEVALLSYANTLAQAAGPLPPALQSVWLKLHVATAVVAYGAFGLSFCLAIAYLALTRPTLRDQMEEAMHWSITVGFPFLTLVIITGAIWAEQVWGRWWSWDPKETWALVTWLIYAAYLHARKTYGWRGKRAALMAVVGFGAVLFTWFGVSFLLPSIHSYL